MNQKLTNKKHHSVQYNFAHISMQNKAKRKRYSVYGSPARNILELKNNLPELKRAGTNELKKNSDDLDNSLVTFNMINKKRKHSYIQSLKFIEKNIKNKILDISIQIEKEDVINSVISKNNNNLNLSTYIKKQIEGELDSSPKNHKAINNKKIMNKNLNTDISENSLKLSLVQKNEFQKVNSFSKIHNHKGPDKYRVLLQKKILYDSFNSEEEKENDDDSFYISPKGKFVLIFDSLIILFSLFDVIYTPLRLSKIEGFCSKENNFVNIIYYCTDVLYIFDLILGFVRSYFNFQFIIIKNKPRIVRHYIVTQFWFDFFQAFPAFSFISYLCKKQKKIYCGSYDLNNKEMFLLIFCFVKQMKIFKIIDLKKNSIMYKINEYISEVEILEKIVDFLIKVFVSIFCFYSFISIHIFIGKHSYPNWIVRNGFQNQSLSLLYLTSFYYLITTMTTVGYGDIVVATFSETIFQIIVLSVGITVYSWIVSNIGNYVKNESYASMQFNKDGGILEEIRISHPNMPFKLYNQIFQHLNARKIRQKQCDSNILINSLPYSLKNLLLLTMYKHTINSLKIFKRCKNSDFIVRLLTNFIPLFSKKNAILIHEGQLVENIIFVKNGKLSLQAAIDIEEPEESIKHYLHKNFGDISEDDQILLSKYESSDTNSSLESKANRTPIDIARTVLDTVVNKRTKSGLTSEINESGLGKEMGKWDIGGEDFEESNYQFINIINISKNESYGVVYMFLTKPSPLSLRVKSKKVELLLLRKADALDVSQRYPNIWMKFLKKSYYNTLSIKTRAVNKIKHYWENLEKKSKKRMQLQKCKSNLNPFTIYQLDKENETLKKLRNFTSKNVIKKSSTNLNNKRKIHFEKNVNKILSVNDNKNKNITSINFSSKNKKFLNTVETNVKNNQTEINILNNNISNNNNNDSHINNPLKFNNKLNTNFNSNLDKPESKKSFSNKYIFSGAKIQNRNKRYSRKYIMTKLKTTIKKLKNSRQYYKNLCQKLTISKGIDSNFLNNKFNSSLYATLKNNSNSVFGVTEKINQNVNIFNHINPNIINNITIQNSNNILYNSNDKESSDESESSNSEKSQRKFNLEEMTINSVINIFYKAEYINLKIYTSGEFCKNEELRKQSLNFIKVFLQIESKKNKKLRRKSYSKSIKNSKIDNPYVSNYDFRHILNKIKLNWQRKNSILNTPKTIKSKKHNISNSSYLLTPNNDKNHKNLNNTFTNLLKNNLSNKNTKIINTKRSNKNSFRINHQKDIPSPTKTLFHKNKTINSLGESKEKKDNNTVAYLKLRTKKKTIKEWENDNTISKKSDFENDIKRFNSINSDENKNGSDLHTLKNEINSYKSDKSINNNYLSLHYETNNDNSFKS